MPEQLMPNPVQCGPQPLHMAKIPNKSVWAFLQARMGSVRLRGKVLMKIDGQSILQRAMRRLWAARIIDRVAVLTTTLDEDNAVVDEAHSLGASVYRGPNLDVLKRFQEAADIYRPDVVVRATADNPLIDIGSIERIVRVLMREGADLCMEMGLPYGAATEAFTVKALRSAHNRARKADYREHVTLYMKEHPEEFHTIYLTPPDALRHPRIRLTVDTQDDFIFVDRLIRKLPEGERPLPLSDYLAFAPTILAERECKELADF